ncbi:hypothetical protein AMECASPLE_039533 [Ameca splendens]|uniref:Uncharacterized protein n=1 Tax=Ameca splendens TaxID=208324 RepID=A0ABV0XXN2_9TELE
MSVLTSNLSYPLNDLSVLRFTWISTTGRQFQPASPCSSFSLFRLITTPLPGVSFSRRTRTRHWQAFHAAIGLAHAIGRLTCIRRAHTHHCQAFHSAVGLTHAIGRRFIQPSGSIAIGRHFMQPSGSHMPLAGIYKHALASISILSLVRHSSNHFDNARCSPSSPDLASAIHASSVITQDKPVRD